MALRVTKRVTKTTTQTWTTFLRHLHGRESLRLPGVHQLLWLHQPQGRLLRRPRVLPLVLALQLRDRLAVRVPGRNAVERQRVQVWLGRFGWLLQVQPDYHHDHCQDYHNHNHNYQHDHYIHKRDHYHRYQAARQQLHFGIQNKY